MVGTLEHLTNGAFIVNYYKSFSSCIRLLWREKLAGTSKISIFELMVHRIFFTIFRQQKPDVHEP